MASRSSRKTVGIGIVGMGFMGTTHLAAGASLRGARVAAIVTGDPRKARGDFRGVRGNFGEGGGRISLEGVTVHSTLDSLLEDPRVDLVDVCLPSFLHPAAAFQCLRAGKHVLVEKPVALEVADARRMIAAARGARRLLMVAQVLKFFPEFALIADRVRDGKWGRLLALHLRRTIARPDWGAGSWFSDVSRSGGMVVDLHIHDTDFVNHVLGRPSAVQSAGVIEGGRIDFIRTTYLHGAKGPLVSAEAGWINAPGLPFQHGYDAYFEKATCRFDSARSPAPVLHGARGSKDLPVPAADAFRTELQLAADAVRSGKAPAGLSAETAASSLEICRAEERSARTGKTVRIG
jgi:predicted dehydrogenase